MTTTTDCCGLVRKVMKDLRAEFGFLIGNWNQAYQFDTLPVVLQFDQLQPGDLIFYEGTYTSSRSKRQKHNMTHVEVREGATHTSLVFSHLTRATHME